MLRDIDMPTGGIAVSHGLGLVLMIVMITGCRTPGDYRREADQVAYDAIERKQKEALGKTEPFTIELPSDMLRRRLLLEQDLPFAHAASQGTRHIEPIEEWPEDDYLEQDDSPDTVEKTSRDRAMKMSLLEALQVAARNSREYQTQKERVFQSALRLDLERDEFRNTWRGITDSLASTDLSRSNTVAGMQNSQFGELAHRFKSGMTFATSLTIDLVKLLTMDKSSSLGLFADATVSFPLLRGSGAFVVAEPLTQAERDVVYAIFQFERFKRTFAVKIATDYLAVLQQLDQVENEEENYKRLIMSTRRARRRADAGMVPEIQVDQAIQDELRARDRWISAQQTYIGGLDSFKRTLGLPTDAQIELYQTELNRLADTADEVSQQPDLQADAGRGEDSTGVAADTPIELVQPSRVGAGQYELDESHAIRLALSNRLDLRITIGRVFDAQRTVVVAADTLRADLTLFGSAAMGQRRTLGAAGLPDAELRPEKGFYSVLATLDLPLERTTERNLYRNSLINLEQVVRDVQALEDQIKFEVRNNLRDLLESREQLSIRDRSVTVAKRRVASADLFLQAGRAQIRDLLEANEDLTTAQNALTAARVRYRIAELAMQRDMGVLEVDETGIWREYTLGDDNDLDP